MALVIAMAMVLALTTAAFADTTYEGDTNYDTTWSGTLDNSISITGLKENDAVSFYQILTYDQDASSSIDAATSAAAGAASWKATTAFSSMTLADFKAILTTGITAEIAGRLAKMATGDATYTANATSEGVATKTTPGAGLYVAIISPATAGMMYNPIFVASDYYTTDGGDKSSTWAVVDSPLSYSDKAMAKVATVTVDKTASDSKTVDTTEDGTTGNYTNTSETVNVGDVIDFTVGTTIPEFADNYTNASYVVTDTLTDGLQLLNSDATAAASDSSYSVTVKITPGKATESGTAGSEAEIKASDSFAYTDDNGAAQTAAPFTITASATGYTITFNKYYLLTQISADTKLTITYKAKVLDAAATTSVNQEDNTVVVSFNNNPNDSTSKTKLVDRTKHYTFDIDADLLGQTTGSWVTTEVVKVGLDADGNEITDTNTTLHTGQTKVGALEGAKFKLYTAYTDESTNTPYTNSLLTSEDYIVSDSNGRLNIYDVSESASLTGIRGLDAGTYYLVETEAPAGYIKHQDPIKIEIIPTFAEKTENVTDGTDTLTVTVKELVSYVVKINDVQTASYTLTYEEDTNTNTTGDTTGTASAATQGDTVTGADTAGYIEANDAATDASRSGKITNTRGVELPSTGGIGTTIFYVVGAILVIGAGVILITRRRMDA